MISFIVTLAIVTAISTVAVKFVPAALGNEADESRNTVFTAVGVGFLAVAFAGLTGYIGVILGTVIARKYLSGKKTSSAE